MENKPVEKYLITKGQDHFIVFETNDLNALNVSIMVNYPLGEFDHIEEYDFSHIFVFENFNIVIHK